MVALLTFAVALLLAVLISGLAQRTVLSTAGLFLVAGFIAGSGVLGFVPGNPHDPVITWLAKLALFAVLFTDGMRVSWRELRTAWLLPGRALILGMPLTMGLIAVLAWAVVGVPWIQAFLLGAVLSPTDPVFASAIVGREEIPGRLRQLLNVESGLNDGLALPVVLILVAWVQPGSRPNIAAYIGELALGVAVGVGVALVIAFIARARFFQTAQAYQALFGFSVGLLVLATAEAIQANIYLAAFTAGITLASVRPRTRPEFYGFGEPLAELLKLAALFAFAVLITPAMLLGIGWQGYVFALLTLIVARPVAIEISLLGSELNWCERVTAAWFGPKGFASVVYAILVLEAPVPNAERLFHLIAVAIAWSILLHSSTDVPFARWFRKQNESASSQEAAA